MIVFCSSCLFFGCGKKEEESGKNIPTSGGDTIDNTNTLDNQENTSGGEKEHSEDVKLNQEEIKNTLQNQVQEEEIIFELLENYKEKNIPSVYTQDNENEHYCNVLLNENREIVYYTYADDEDGYFLWKYTLKEGVSEDDAFWTYKNGAGWEREPVLWLGDIKSKIIYGELIIFRGEDNNDYAWYMGEGERAYLVKRTKDSYTEVPISDWSITDTEHATVAVLANGNVVVADAGRECFIYNPEDGSLITQFKCGWYESICVRGNIIYISAHGGASVQRYNAEEQEFLPTIEADFNRDVRIALQDDDVYVCPPTGIFRAKENGTSFQKVLEAGTFHFSKNTGVLLKFFVIGDAFYVVYGEDKGSIKRYSPLEEKDDVTKSLTVYSLENNELILDMISEFQDQYPDIELIYETGEGADGSISMSDRIRALNARILAGDGPDVLLLDGLPVESYIKKGILGDLSPVLGSMKEELLPNILSAYYAEDKIYMLPLRIIIPMFMTSGQTPELYSTLEALVEYSEKEGGVANLLGYSYANILEILYYNYTPDIILENKTVNREAIVKFLTLVKRFCESEQITETSVGTGAYLKGFALTGYFFVTEAADLGFMVANGLYELGTNPAAVEARGGELVNNGGIFFPNAVLGLNELSEKKELSHLFIQYAFSYDAQDRKAVSWSGYPIHAEVLKEYEQSDLSDHLMAVGEISLRRYTAQESARMVQVVREVHTPVAVEASIWEIFSEVAENYLKGVKNLDESADEMVSRLQLYLYEQ